MKAVVHVPALSRMKPQPKPKPKLADPMRKDGTFPFEYRSHAHTDVAATIARVREEIANGERKL